MATSDPLAARVEAVVAGLDRRAQVLQLFLVAVRFSDVDGGAELACRAFTTLGEGLPNARTVAVQPMWDASDYSGSVTEVLMRRQERCRVGRWQYAKIASPLARRPKLVREDRVHATEEGQKVVAAAVNKALSRS